MACSRRCSDAWISFLARVRDRTSCSRRASRRRRIRQRSSGIHTASSSPLHNKLANARASSLSVFARALAIPVSSGLRPPRPGSTCGSSSRATSQQLPVTSNATRSDGHRLSASALIPSGVLGTRPAERTSPSSQIATSQNSRCTSRPIARPTHLGNPILSPPQLGLTVRENQRDNDTDRYELDSSIQASRRGGRTKSTGSKPIDQNGLPVCVLPRSPCPGSPNLRPAPDGPSKQQFHASRRSSADASRERFSGAEVGPRSAIVWGRGCDPALIGPLGTRLSRHTESGRGDQRGSVARRGRRNIALHPV